MNRGSGERLLQLHRGTSPIILALESLGGIPPLLHRAEPGLYPLGELRAAHPGNALHRFLDAAVGPDAETDRVLSHPGREKGEWMLAVFSAGDEDR